MRNIGFKIVLIVCLLVVSAGVHAQYVGSGTGIYAFLDLPVSSHLNALGGTNVSVRDGDISMAMRNPALLGAQTGDKLELNFSYLMKGTTFASALYGHNFSQHDYFGVGVHYLDYGKMQYADVYGNTEGKGTFGARDIVLNAMYARQLGPCFTLGVALKPVISNYEAYTSFALGADVGAHFQTHDTTWQVGVSLQNIGWQLKGYYSEEGGQKREMLPLNLQIGFNYWFRKAPIRLGMTIHNLQSPKLNYRYTNPYTPALKEEPESTEIGVADMIFRHTIFYLDIVPRDEKYYLTVSYNHRRRGEMNLTDQFSLAGFAIGGGIRMSGVHAGVAVSQLTKSNLSVQLSLGLDIRYLQDQTMVRRERARRESTLSAEEKAEQRRLEAERKAEEAAAKAAEKERKRIEREERQERFTRALQGL